MIETKPNKTKRTTFSFQIINGAEYLGVPWQCPPGEPSGSAPFPHCREASCVLSLMPLLTATLHDILLFSLGQLKWVSRQRKNQAHIYPASWPKLSKLFLLLLVAHGYIPPPQPKHALRTHPAWALPVWSIHLRGSRLTQESHAFSHPHLVMKAVFFRAQRFSHMKWMQLPQLLCGPGLIT